MNLERIQYKYDMLIYKLAYKSIKRLCDYNVGFIYLFKLQIDDWIKENRPSESVKRSAEIFYKSLKEQKRNL